MEGLIVRDTLPRASDMAFGQGIVVQNGAIHEKGSVASISWTAVERNRSNGVLVLSSEATIEASVIRGTLEEASDQTGGRGLNVEDFPVAGRSLVTLRSSLIEQNLEGGVFVGGSDGVIESTIVRDTEAQISDQEFGVGIAAQFNPETGERSSLALRWSVVSGNRTTGVSITGSDAEIIASDVRDTKPHAKDNTYGDGVVVWYYKDIPAKCSVMGSRLSGSSRAGLSNFGADVSLGSTELECNPIHLDGEEAQNPWTFTDLGGTVCGCGGATTACKVLSSNLEPPKIYGP
jgi:hypothetical protein